MTTDLYCTPEFGRGARDHAARHDARPVVQTVSKSGRHGNHRFPVSNMAIWPAPFNTGNQQQVCDRAGPTISRTVLEGRERCDRARGVERLVGFSCHTDKAYI